MCLPLGPNSSTSAFHQLVRHLEPDPTPTASSPLFGAPTRLRPWADGGGSMPSRLAATYRPHGPRGRLVLLSWRTRFALARSQPNRTSGRAAASGSYEHG